jgi:hypothetical protein
MGTQRRPAQTGIRRQVTTNIQAPNTVEINQTRAAQDVSSQHTGENEVQVT